MYINLFLKEILKEIWKKWIYPCCSESRKAEPFFIWFIPCQTKIEFSLDPGLNLILISPHNPQHPLCDSQLQSLPSSFFLSHFSEISNFPPLNGPSSLYLLGHSDLTDCWRPEVPLWLMSVQVDAWDDTLNNTLLL